MLNVKAASLSCLALLISYTHASAASGYERDYGKPQAAECSKLCSVLNKSYPHLLDYPGEAGYNSPYWSLQQEHTKPACRFSPNSAEDVSAAILKIREIGCPFAVKSGGHVGFLGASNIQGGVTIDLRNLNKLTVAKDKTITYLGTGLHWENVYAPLDRMNLSVVGGRSGDVGVGGLTLGGGISFFSGVYGYACDNVENYQVVLANGSIVDANPRANSDLFHALRGGGNNFGVVTRMDVKTIKQGLMLGGENVYTMAYNYSFFDAFYWFNKNAGKDPKASLIVANACTKSSGCLLSNLYNHMDPVPLKSLGIYSNFSSYPTEFSTERISNMSDFAQELKASQPSGYRQSWVTFTVKNDAQLLKDMFNKIYYPSVQPLFKETSTSVTTFALQPITLPIIKNFAKNGGNALGVSEADGPLTLINMDFQWDAAEEDHKVQGAQQDILARCIKLAKSRSLSHRYIYQNYAYISQDVFNGYGLESKRRLLEIQQRYDPQNIFTNLQPGYFKLRKLTSY